MLANSRMDLSDWWRVQFGSGAHKFLRIRAIYLLATRCWKASNHLCKSYTWTLWTRVTHPSSETSIFNPTPQKENGEAFIKEMEAQ